MAQQQRHRALRVIAAYKLVKAFGLLLVAAAAFGLVREARFEAFAEWVLRLPIQHGHRFLVHLLDKLLDIGPRRFTAIGIATCIYAAVFVVEGWGLWRGKRWAEYLTVVVTASLIPLEIWEILRHFTWLRVAAFAVNVAIVWYLIRLLRNK
jgi:uncharacterized membrane protein (DUF2068 family)